ncbi:hypothetical protein HanRHA438_Chr05g0226901 [Helianthus annuus]|nr:hypothetical protein HanRHA438_Chr05g0226901 [Helianthus annuus]
MIALVCPKSHVWGLSFKSCKFRLCNIKCITNAFNLRLYTRSIRPSGRSAYHPLY